MLERSRLRDFFENLLEALEDRVEVCGLMFGDDEAMFGFCVCILCRRCVVVDVAVDHYSL